MKKTAIRALCLALVLALLVPALALATNYGYRYVKTGNGKGLNVRESAGTSGKFIVSIPYRALVLVYQYNDNKTWAYIEADNPKGSGTVKGWVNASFLVKKDPGPYKKPGGDTPTEPTFSDINNAARKMVILDEPYETVIQTKVATNYVHLRWFPSKSACYSGEYLRGEEIKVLAVSNAWAQVEILESGYVGFIVIECVAPVVEDEADAATVSQ